MTQLKISTWNINSVRLRIGLVARFLREEQPDVLCLQETKCRDDQFPLKAFAKEGYTHVAYHGQPGYHGVAIAARVPLTQIGKLSFCGKDDTRHISAVLDCGLQIHNFYVPAGGDEPDPDTNEKFRHKLDFLTEMATDFVSRIAPRSVLVGDLNVAPGEQDVWSHKQLLKVVSHTPVEVAALQKIVQAGGWTDVARLFVPPEDKLYSWWSYRARDWRASDRGRRLDHIWVSQALKDTVHSGGHFQIHQDARGWEKPSDHAPVSLSFDI